MTSASLFLTIAAANGGIAVIMGAFGAHGLRGKLAERMMNAFETGAEYHLVHAVVLLIVGVLLLHLPQSGLLKTSGWFFTVGMLLFSGSLYVMAISGIRVLGAITPVGGLTLIIGWGLLAVAAYSGFKAVQ